MYSVPGGTCWRRSVALVSKRQPEHAICNLAMAHCQAKACSLRSTVSKHQSLFTQCQPVSFPYRQRLCTAFQAVRVQGAERDWREDDGQSVRPAALPWVTAWARHAAESAKRCCGPCAGSSAWVPCPGHVCFSWRYIVNHCSPLYVLL